MKTVISAQAQKAICLLRSHYVFTVRPVATGFWGDWKVPEFTLDYGIFNTRSGARIVGFGRQTFRELHQKKLLSAPASFKVLRYHSPDKVYTLSPRAVDLVVLMSIVHTVHETFREVE